MLFWLILLFYLLWVAAAGLSRVGSATPTTPDDDSDSFEEGELCHKDLP